MPRRRSSSATGCRSRRSSTLFAVWRRTAPRSPAVVLVVAQRPCQTRAMAAGDAKRIFTGIAVSYDRVANVLSLGQDPRWRRALVDAIDARPTDRVLDVATGTGMVAQALHDRYGCAVVGFDQSEDMLRLARTRDGVYDTIVKGRAEEL